MMLLCGQTNAIWSFWAGRYPNSVGFLISPSYISRVQPKKFMPFALDNDAFKAWKNKEPWNYKAWSEMLKFVRMTGLDPLWAAVPDVVADRQGTLANWKLYADEILNLGWPAAFCVQDGMTPDDVPEQAGIVFVGGTDRWKFPNLKMWTESFPRVHCARVNAPKMFEACERLGCESIDGTGWFRDPSRDDKVPALERFIEGHRSHSIQKQIEFA